MSDGDPLYLHDEVIGLISAAGGTQGLQAIDAMPRDSGLEIALPG